MFGASAIVVFARPRVNVTAVRILLECVRKLAHREKALASFPRPNDVASARIALRDFSAAVGDYKMWHYV